MRLDEGRAQAGVPWERTFVRSDLPSIPSPPPLESSKGLLLHLLLYTNSAWLNARRSPVPGTHPLQVASKQHNPSLLTITVTYVLTGFFVASLIAFLREIMMTPPLQFVPFPVGAIKFIEIQ